MYVQVFACKMCDGCDGCELVVECPETMNSGSRRVMLSGLSSVLRVDHTRKVCCF